MQHNPNPELIDEENPEWTEAMFREAKTATQLFPQLLKKHRDKKITPVNKIKETVFLMRIFLLRFAPLGKCGNYE